MFNGLTTRKTRNVTGCYITFRLTLGEILMWKTNGKCL